ncbi:hypothetical protein G9A89_015353 [Geosiphon pyriformis]|nr:hypothetical protein G9A89_015353 [Geosiphon pyriformis]
MSTQSPVFAVGLVIEDAFEKNQEVWLVLQNMQKAYNSVGWHHLRASLWRIKMCERIEGNGGLTSYFSAGIFVDDTIWVGNCQTSTQYMLNIASEFFVINNISINNEKTIAIPINQGVKIAKLSICGQPILIAKKGKDHHYLGIFLSTKGLSKPSVAKAHVDVHFFVNVVLRKIITDKQFSYLVLTVLQPIVSYCIQFSFVSFNVCHKWDALIKKDFRSKACLPCDFPDAALHHPLLYGLKPFEQMQSEKKIAVLIIPVNNFLAGLVKIFLDNGLSLVNNLPTAFYSPSCFPMSAILGKSLYFDLVISLRHFDILRSGEFSAVKNGLHDVWSGFFEVFMDGSLKNFGSAEVASGAAAYFLALDLSVDIAVQGLLLSTMAELQTVALSLECVFSSSTVVLHLNSQTAINACMSEMSLAVPNFHNQCWIERCHIFNLVKDKDLSVSWIKMKGHSGVPRNVEADLAAGTASGSPFFLLAGVCKHFLVVKGTPVSGNTHYFVRDIFYSVCRAHWEAGPDFNIVLDVMIVYINWIVTVMVWHPDSHMLTGFTSYKSSMLQTYLIKAVHRRLLIVIRKRMYDRHYPGVLCLLCSGVKFSDHSFTCAYESSIRDKILAKTSAHWFVLAGVSRSSASTVLRVLF